jgi:hypothetical protein
MMAYRGRGPVAVSGWPVVVAGALALGRHWRQGGRHGEGDAGPAWRCGAEPVTGTTTAVVRGWGAKAVVAD